MREGTTEHEKREHISGRWKAGERAEKAEALALERRIKREACSSALQVW